MRVTSTVAVLIGLIFSGALCLETNGGQLRSTGVAGGEDPTFDPSSAEYSGVTEKEALGLGYVFLAGVGPFMLIVSIIAISCMCVYQFVRAKNNAAPDGKVDDLSSPLLLGNEQYKWALDGHDLQVVDKCGSGATGRVYKANWGCEEVAVKEFVLGSHRVFIHSEVDDLVGVSHPSILRLWGCVPDANLIVMEYAERGSLSSLVHSDWMSGELEREEYVKKMTEVLFNVARGMAYLHSHNPPILHRDLKPSNILLDRNLQAKIADIGISKQMTYGMYKSQSCGAPAYAAPEAWQGVLEGEDEPERFTTKSDVFSFGLMMWEVLTRDPSLLDGQHSFHVAQMIIQGGRPEIPDEIRSKNPSHCTLMEECWMDCPNERPSFSEIMEIMRSNGTKRNSAEAIPVPRNAIRKNSRGVVVPPKARPADPF